MAKEKQTKSRIIHKHDIEANWNKAVNFIPDKGETIVYDIDDNYSYERIKMGDGETTVIALPFITDNIPQPDWNAREGEVGYVKNRTHWVEGNRTVVNWNESLTAISNGSGTYYRVSTLTPTKEEIIGGTFVKSDGTTFAIDSSLISKTTYWLEISMGAIYIVYGKENQSITFNGLTFPGCGIYFTKNAYKQIVSMTWGEEVVHKLDKKFLPDDIGAGADWSQNNETAPDYVKNRTHYEQIVVFSESQNSKELTPVGYRADDRKAYFHDNFFIEVYFPDGRRYISDPDFVNNKLFINEETGDIISSRLTADRTNGAWKLALFTDDIPSYMAYKYIITKPLDIKYIPDEIARVATMETITPEMIIEMMDEVGAAQPIADADNAVLTTDDDKILIL